MEVRALPPVTRNIKDPTPYVDLANSLIKAGPSTAWHLLDSLLVNSPSTYIGDSAIAGVPEDTWCKLLAILPLLFDWRTLSDLGDIPGQALPGNLPISRFKDGYVFISIFFIRFDRSPGTLRRALGTADWRLYRRSPIVPCYGYEERDAAALANSVGQHSDYYLRLIRSQTRALQETVRKRRAKQLSGTKWAIAVG